MMNKKYSFGSFKYRSFTGKSPEEFNNSTIQGSCFEQKKPGTRVFPEGLKYVRFIGCNLNNCALPTGIGIVVEASCVADSWAYQNDKEQWKVDKNGKPLEPMNRGAFEKLLLSTLPGDIPDTPLGEEITVTKKRMLDAALKEFKTDDKSLLQILRAAGKI